MDGMLGRTGSRDNLGEAGRHNMLSALPPPPMPLGVPNFNAPGVSNDGRALPPYGHLAPLPRKPEVPPLHPSAAQDPSRSSSPAPEPAKRTVQVYRKRLFDATGLPPFDFGAGHVPGMLAHPEGEGPVPNLPPRSGTGMRLRPARLPAVCCIPPPQPEPLVPQDEVLPQVLRLHDQRRVASPATVANLLVFDCIERPPASAAPAGGGGGGAASARSVEPQGQQQPQGQAAAAGGQGAGGTEGGGAGSISDPAGAGAGAGGGGGPGGTPGDGAGGRGGSSTGAGEGTAAGAGPVPGSGPATSGADAAAGPGPADMAAARAAAGPPSCSYDTRTAGPRTTAYDYYEDMPAWYSVRGPDDHTLVFESRFESGNLRRAIQVYPYEYDLILRPDINTRGHTQWFFFALGNTRAGCRYKVNIINLLKEDSLYNDGMQPLVHSAKAQAGRGLGWHRAGQRVCYYANTIRRGRSGKTYYTLTFTLTTEYDNDLVHVAHCYPYTYTDLQRYLRAVELDPSRRHRMKREPLAASLAGNSVEVLTITGGGHADEAEAMKRRKAVVISARVHPGESNASWMMKGVLDYLLGPSLDAKMLRDHFVFKIIPMLNPDGVICGNYRCSLAGVDLNRVWQDPSRKLHPVIHATKIFLRQLSEEREVALFCDLHGHSRKLDVFMYGCEKKLPRDGAPVFPGWPVPGSLGGQASIPTRFQEKMVPLLIHHNAPDLFSYRHCSFKVQKSKSGTGRVVGFRELGLVNSFTLEASFAGASQGRYARQHFSTAHLEQQGAALVAALLDYWDPDAYGYGDLLGQLDFLHPANGDAPPRFITTPDGQLVEVEDDDVPTDSDDESSDDGGARARARTAHGGRTQAPGVSIPMGPLSRDPQSAAFMQQYYNAYGMAGAGALGPVGEALGGRTASLRGPNDPRLADVGDRVASDSEVVLDPRKAKRRARAALQKALLRAEQAKADEGLAACLPMMAALQVNSPKDPRAPQSGDPGFALVTNAHRTAVDPHGHPAPHRGRAGGPSNSGAAGGPGGQQHRAIEYAKQRGVYRGEAPQWTVPGLNSAYDNPEAAAGSPPSPGQGGLGAPAQPPSPQPRGGGGGGGGLLSNSTTGPAFAAMMLSPNNPASAGVNLTGGAAGPGGGGGGSGSGGGGGGPHSFSSQPHSVGAGGRPPAASLGGGRPAAYAFAAYGGSQAVAREAREVREEYYAVGMGGPLAPDAGGAGRPSSGTNFQRNLSPLQGVSRPYTGHAKPQPRLSGDAPGGGGGAGGRNARVSNASRSSGAGSGPMPEDADGGTAEYDAPHGMPYGGGHSTAAAALSYHDPERLRRDREELEQRVAETVLTGSPLFQRF